MSSEQAPASTVPPVRRGPMQTGPAASVWPIVIGTLSIVFGAGGVIGYGCFGTLGTAMIAAMGRMFREMAKQNPQMEVQAAQMEAMGAYSTATLASNAAAGALAVVLLVAGIGVVSRRRWGVKTSVVFSILKMLYAIPAVYLGYRMGVAQFDAMQQAAAQQTQQPGVNVQIGMVSMMRHFGSAGAVMQLLWIWAWPVFLIVWFARPKIRRETAEWASGRKSAGASGAAVA